VGSEAVVQEAEVAVKVAVVARPLLPFELEKGATSHVQLVLPNKVSVGCFRLLLLPVGACRTLLCVPLQAKAVQQRWRPWIEDCYCCCR
jgi:hypothetical protein